MTKETKESQQERQDATRQGLESSAKRAPDLKKVPKEEYFEVKGADASSAGIANSGVRPIEGVGSSREEVPLFFEASFPDYDSLSQGLKDSPLDPDSMKRERGSSDDDMTSVSEGGDAPSPRVANPSLTTGIASSAKGPAR